MTEVDQSTLPVAPSRSAIAGVSSAVVVGWLIAFTGLEWVRFKLGSVAAPTGLADVTYILSALECFELFLLVKMFSWKSDAPPIGALEAMATLLGAAVLLLFANSRPIFSAGLLAFYVLCRFGRTDQHRRVAIGLFAFISQYLLLAGPFIWLHTLVGRIDASVMRWVLQTAGYDITGYGTLVVRASQNFATDVQWGCSSSNVAAIAIPGFVITILGFRGWIRGSDLAYLAVLLAAVVLINWLRLIPIELSREGWLYWHEGNGSSIVAAINGLVIVGLGYLATVHSNPRRVSR